jgi:hypothetical protein
MLAVEPNELAARGEPGELLEEETALAATAEAELAHELLVSGLLPGTGRNARHEFAIGHRFETGFEIGFEVDFKVDFK